MVVIPDGVATFFVYILKILYVCGTAILPERKLQNL